MTSYFDYLGALDSPGKVAPRGQGQRFRAQGVKGLFSHPSGGSPASGGLFGGGGGGGTTTPINVDQPDNPFSEIDIDQTSQDAITALYESGDANLGSIGKVMQDQRDREIAEQMEAARAEEAAKQQAIYEAQMEQQRLENEKAMQEQIEQQAAIQAQLDEINNRPVVEPVVQPDPVVQPEPVVEAPSGPLNPGPDDPASQIDPAAQPKPAPIRPLPTLPQENVPVAEQIDGSLRPVTGDPLLTDAPAQTPDEVNVLPTVTGDTFAGGGSQPVTTPTPPASRPGINIVPGAGGDIGLTIDGKTPGQLIVGSKPGQAIVNKLPDVLTQGPGTFPMPTGMPTHINTGGAGGFGGTGIGVLAPIAGGKPTVYGTWDASAVADLMKNPIGVLREKGQDLGDGIRDVWGKIKDVFTREQQEEVEEAIDEEENKDVAPITAGTTYSKTEPTSVTGGNAFSQNWYENPLGTGEPVYNRADGSVTTVSDSPYRYKSPLSDFGVQVGLLGNQRGLPYSKFPVDGGDAATLGDVIADKMAPDPNTLQSELDRMVGQSLPFVSVTGEDGTPYLYDKQNQQTYTLPDYMSLVAERNKIGLPAPGRRVPGLPTRFGGSGRIGGSF